MADDLIARNEWLAKMPRDFNSLPDDEPVSIAAGTIREAATALAARDEEIRLLREALAKANDQAEHFEREWYLREDAIEAAYREGHAQGRSYWYRADFPQPDSDWLNSKARASLTPPTA